MCVENLADSLALLVVDLSRPWLALDSLHKWTSVLRDYLDKLRVPPETMRELELGCMCVCSLFFSHKHLSASGVKTKIKTSLHSRTPVCPNIFDQLEKQVKVQLFVRWTSQLSEMFFSRGPIKRLRSEHGVRRQRQPEYSAP